MKSKPADKNSLPANDNTEEKIKKAARAVFHRKGFAATRTRDIAEAANINLALLNYYFRSKRKLFELVMMETIIGFMQKMQTVFFDENSTLEEKVERIANNYIDLFTAEPAIPLFIMNEIRSNGAETLEKLPLAGIILQSPFIKQYHEGVASGKIAEPNPLHFIMTLLGMLAFPFIGSPLLKRIGRLTDEQFNALMQERKQLVPLWIKAVLQAK